MSYWSQAGHQNNYAISPLKHIVLLLSRSEGLQKRLALCGTNMHMVALAIDVCTLGQTSHKETKTMM
jgi:hypothetical protein